MAPPFVPPPLPPPPPPPPSTTATTTVVPLPPPPPYAVSNTAPSPVPLYANPIQSQFPAHGHAAPPPLPPMNNIPPTVPHFLPAGLPPSPAMIPTSFGMVFQVASQHYHHRVPPPTLPPPPVPPPSADRTAAHFPNYGHAVMQRVEMMEVAARAPAPLDLANAPDRVSEAAKLARSRALAVLQNIQKRDDYLQNRVTNPQTEVGRKRKACLEKLEERKKVAMIKNLEYLARVEDERLHAKLELYQEAQDYQSRMEDDHELILKRRSDQRSFERQSQAGLGTAQQKQAEARQRRRKQHQRGNTGNPNSRADTIALYLSNLPTNDSSFSSMEELLAALFGNLGYDLQKIHVYKHKVTGAPKGDALAIYRLPQPTPEDASDAMAARERVSAVLIDTVCSQMNGAELPGGNIISVQPSDSAYKCKTKKEELPNHYGPSETKKNETAGDGGGDDDDLDGFFASLNGDGQKKEQALQRDEQSTKQTQPSEAQKEGEKAPPSTRDNESDLDDFFESLT